MTILSHSGVALASVIQLLQGVRIYKYVIRLSYINGMTFIPSTDRTVQMVQNMKSTHECVHVCARTHTEVVC
jgi:hypothetical protein